MNIDMKNITTYLGCFVIVLFILFGITKALSLNNKVVEGLTNSKSSPEEILKELQKKNKNSANNLDIKKDKSTYHDILLQLEDSFHFQMIEEMLNKEKTTDLTSKLSQLQAGKAALKDLDEFLTHYKPS
jgi:hypothetical protein